MLLQPRTRRDRHCNDAAWARGPRAAQLEANGVTVDTVRGLVHAGATYTTGNAHDASICTLQARTRRSAPVPEFRIELLGHLRILWGGEPVATLSSARRRALLAYLALHYRDSIDRKQLAYLFWPDSEDGQARTNLRRELHHLRSELPCADDVIDLGAEALRWKVGDPSLVDVAGFEAALADAAEAREHKARRAERSALARAVELYRGDLLPALYDDWVEGDRERLRAGALAALKRLVELCEAAGATDSALDYAERRIRIDPLDEATYRVLMRLHQRAGNRAAAINAFHRCAGVLQRELDLDPSQATREAYETLLEAEGGPTPVEAPMETRGAAPLVGRGEALSSLADAWRDVRVHGPSAAIVYGEAGMGKTRLVEEFVRVCLQQGASVVRARAYATEGRFSYGLAVAWLRNAVVAERLAELPPAWRAEVARLAPELDTGAPARSDPDETVPASWQRRRLLEAVARAVLAAPPPVLVVADDLQWADADSLDALHLLTHLDESAALLVVATARTEELPGNAPLEHLLVALRAEGRLRDIELGTLSPQDTAHLARQVAGAPVEGAALAHLQRVSEGVPLFVVESVRADIAAAALSGGGPLLQELPPRVRAVLAARLNQLSPDARELAELAATLGRAFRFETLRHASDLLEETLVRSLDELWRRRIVLEQAAGMYDFSHDVLRDAAYGSIEPARRRLFHRRVARALESVHAGDTGPVGGRLAQHYEQGGEIGRAVDAYRNAAQEAVRVFSHEDAVKLLDRALSLLEHLPASEERERRELELQLAKIIPARSLGGYTAPTLARAAERAADIADRHHDNGALYHALRSLQTTRFVSGHLARALELSERLQALAHHVPERQAEGDHAMAGSLLTVGDLSGALEHFGRAERGYDPVTDRAAISVFGADQAVFTAAWQAHAQWLAGLCDRARVSSERAVQLADELAHPYSQALAHAYAAVFHHMRRDPRTCLVHAAAVRDICEKHGFAYYVHWGRLLASWAEPGEVEETRLTQMREAIDGLEREGAAVRRPFYLSVLAIALARAGRVQDARSALAEAHARAEATQERWWTPEIARLQGLLASSAEERMACLQTAVHLASELRAPPLAARSAVSLALSFRSRARLHDARAVLAKVLDGTAPRAGDRDRRRAERTLAWLSA